MSGHHHLTIDQRVRQFRRFYRRENRRPLFGFFEGSEDPLFRYPHAATLPTERALVPEDFDVEDYADDSVALFGGHEACGGDNGFGYFGSTPGAARVTVDYFKYSVYTSRPSTSVKGRGRVGPEGNARPSQSPREKTGKEDMVD